MLLDWNFVRINPSMAAPEMAAARASESHLGVAA